jgi:hypothetical protein
MLHLAVRQRLAQGRIGTIFAFSGQMAHYVPQATGARFIMDFVDMDSAKFAQQGASARGLAGIALRHEAKRLLAFETAREECSRHAGDHGSKVADHSVVAITGTAAMDVPVPATHGAELRSQVGAKCV